MHLFLGGRPQRYCVKGVYVLLLRTIFKTWWRWGIHEKLLYILAPPFPLWTVLWRNLRGCLPSLKSSECPPNKTFRLCIFSVAVTLVVLKVMGEDEIPGEREAKQDQRGHMGGLWETRREVRNSRNVMKAKDRVSVVRRLSERWGCS